MNAREATDLYREAKQLYAQGRVEEALGILERLEKAYPDQPRLAKAKARCLSDLEGATAAQSPAAAVVPALQISGLLELDSPVTYVRKPVSQSSSNGWMVYAGAAALVLALAAGGTVWAARHQPAKAPKATVQPASPAPMTASAPAAPILPTIAIAKPSQINDSQAAGYPVVLNRSSFSSFSSQGVVLVDFWAAWCPPCRRMLPIVDEVAAEYRGRVRVGKVNTDQEKELMHAYKVTGIPTFMVFRNGQLLYRHSGGMPKETLEGILDSALKGR